MVLCVSGAHEFQYPLFSTILPPAKRRIAFLINNGQRVWNVVHESDNGIYHLAIEGSPPEPFPKIRDDLTKSQDTEGGKDADVDYIFDIPVKLATALSGYSHDRANFDWGTPMYARLKEGKLN